MQFRKRDGKHLTFIRDLSAADQALARKTLARWLGLPFEEWPEPISQMKEMIQERTDSKRGYGAYFKINPDVRDIPEKYSRMVHGVRMLTLGGVDTGGSGCICPSTSGNRSPQRTR